MLLTASMSVPRRFGPCLGDSLEDSQIHWAVSFSGHEGIRMPWLDNQLSLSLVSFIWSMKLRRTPRAIFGTTTDYTIPGPQEV